MALPDRDLLLDIDWLARIRAGEVDRTLPDLANDAADRYGGPVTAVAEALRDLSWLASNVFQSIDLRHGLAHALATGSWSAAPTGGHTLHSCSQWLFPAIAKRRPDLHSENPDRFTITCVPPPLPNLSTLRLAPALDRAWLTPHYGIWGCGVSPDGRYVISGSRGPYRGAHETGHLVVWDAQHGTKTANVGNPYEVRDCAVSPDGRYVISQNNRGTIAVWTLPALTSVGTIEAPPVQPELGHNPLRAPGNVRGSGNRWRRFAMSADAGLLAVAGFNRIRIYRLAPFGMIASVDGLPDLPYGILAMGFAASDRLLIVGRDEPLPVCVWDVKLRRIVERRDLVVPRTGGLARGVLAADQQLLVAGGYGATVVWSLGESSPVAMTRCGIGGQALAVSADGTMAATAGPPPAADESEHVGGIRVEEIRLWSLPDLRELASWRPADLGCRDIVTALAFSPDSRHLILGGWEGVLRRLVLRR